MARDWTEEEEQPVRTLSELAYKEKRIRRVSRCISRSVSRWIVREEVFCAFDKEKSIFFLEVGLMDDLRADGLKVRACRRVYVRGEQ